MTYLAKMFAAFALLQAHSVMAQDHSTESLGDVVGSLDDIPFDEDVSTSGGASSGGKKTKTDPDTTPQITDHDFEPTCKYAYAKGSNSQCFSNIPGCVPSNQWGWTNLIRYTWENMPLYTDAYGCSGGKQVGNAKVIVNTKLNKIYVELSALEGWTIKEWRVHVSQKRLPVTYNKYRASPFHLGFLKQKYYSKKYQCPRPATYTWIVIYVEVCEKCVDGVQEPIVKVIDADADWNALPAIAGEDISEGMPGWVLDDMQSRLHDFPPVYRQSNMQVYFPEQQDGIPAGRKYKFYCPKNCANKPCEVIITHYHCPPCSGPTNGNLPYLLPGDGWTPAHCGPRFRYLADKYDTTAFRKLIPAGETEETPEFARILSNTAAYVRPGATDCEDLSKSQCDVSDECEYDFSNSDCASNWCPPAPPGPPRTCEPCAPSRAA